MSRTGGQRDYYYYIFFIVFSHSHDFSCETVVTKVDKDEAKQNYYTMQLYYMIASKE